MQRNGVLPVDELYWIEVKRNGSTLSRYVDTDRNLDDWIVRTWPGAAVKSVGYLIDVIDPSGASLCVIIATPIADWPRLPERF